MPNTQQVLINICQNKMSWRLKTDLDMAFTWHVGGENNRARIRVKMGDEDKEQLLKLEEVRIDLGIREGQE